MAARDVVRGRPGTVSVTPILIGVTESERLLANKQVSYFPLDAGKSPLIGSAWLQLPSR